MYLCISFLFVYVCLSVAEVYILLSLKVEAGRATVTVDDISRSSPRSFSTRALKTNPIWGTMWTIYGKDKGGIYMKYPPLRYGSGAHKAGWATLSHKIPLFSISTVCTLRAKTTKEWVSEYKKNFIEWRNIFIIKVGTDCERRSSRKTGHGKKEINIQQDASWPDDIIMHWAKFWFQKICTCKD